MFKKRMHVGLALLLMLQGFCLNVAVAAQTDDHGRSELSGHWAEEEIARWSDNGLLQGFPDETMRPDEPLTRAQFVTLLDRLFRLQMEAEISFSDVSEQDWYYQSLTRAYAAGFIQGYPDGSYKPDKSISRQEASTILYKAFQFMDDGDHTVAFSDGDTIDDYALPAVSFMHKSGYIQGYPDGTFAPSAPLTRGSFAAILDRMVETWITQAGDYSGMDVQGNVVINTSDVVLRDTVLRGHLYLTEGINHGKVTLDGMTSSGMIFVTGNPSNITVKDSTLENVLINKVNSHTRVITEGNTMIKTISIGAENNGEAVSVELDGNFESVIIEGDIQIHVSGNVGEMVVQSESAIVNGKTFKQGDIVSVKNGQLQEESDSNTTSSSGSRSSSSDSNSGTTDPDEDEMWTLVWADEFDGVGTNLNENGVDLDKWGFQNGTGAEYGLDGWGNDEQQYYTDDNVRVEDGKLIIEAKNDGREGKPYTSGRLYTAETFTKTYGKFEARIKLPVGQGFWPAFWMMPKDSKYGGWAASGEIDIMEARGRLPDHVGGTIHYGGSWPNNKFTGDEYYFPEGESIDQFHTYAVEWEPGEIRWYVDGNLYQTLNQWDSQGNGLPTKYAYPAPFDEPFYMILNLAVGGTYDGGRVPDDSMFPGIMEVDYVRVYELTGRPYREPIEPVVEPAELPEGAKEPVDGNYVYDADFEQPITIVENGSQSLDTTYWNLVYLDTFGGQASVSVDELEGDRFAKIDISNGGSQTYSVQLIQNVTLTKGRYYKVSFDAKAASNRTINVKLGGGADRGYAVYSNNETFSLKDELDSYAFRFQMLAESDALARLEMNLGTNTASVWIGNVVVEEIDGDVLDENGEKEPLENGEHVYNGSFNLGYQHRMTYWNFNTSGVAQASASVDVDSERLHISISDGGDQSEQITLVQKGIQLLQTDEYTLQFRAAASQPRTIQYALISKDGSENYTGYQTAHLGTEMSNYTFDFTMPAGISDSESQLVFAFGADDSDVYITDISLIRLTDNNVDYSGIDLFPLQNGDFVLDLTAWEPFTQGASATFSTEDGRARIDIANKGAESWSIMLIQSGMSFAKGVEYVFSFEASATVERDMEVTLENASYNRRFQTGSIVLTPETKRFEYTFTPSVDETLALKFLLGNTEQSADEAHQIYIDNVVLEVKDAPVKRPPTLLADEENNFVGQPIELVFADDAQWREAIQALKVNNVVINDDQYTVSSGKISIEAAMFTQDAIYSITVVADGYADATVNQQLFPSDGNLVLNGDFSAGTTSWNHWAGDGGSSEFSVENEEAVVQVTNHGGLHWEWNIPVSWSTQLNQSNIQLEGGKTYQLSFRARATVPRPIQIEYTGRSGNPKENFLITTDDTVYTHTFVQDSDGTMKLNFLLGNVVMDDAVTPDEAHTIYLDDISIREIDPAPTVYADTTDNTLGQSIALTFADDEEWRTTIEEISVTKEDITVTEDTYFTIGAGMITIDADAFWEAGEYTIVIESTDYPDVIVYQTILAKLEDEE